MARASLPQPLTADQRALVEQHVHLVPFLVSKLHSWIVSAQHPLISHADLCTVGYIALCHAAQRYEPRGIAFSTYAAHRIRFACIDAIREATSYNRHTKIAPLRTWSLSDTTVGGAASFEDDDAGALENVLADESAIPIDEQVIQSVTAIALRAAVAALPPRERFVVQFYDLATPPRTMQQIATRLHVTVTRISQIHKNALRHLASMPAVYNYRGAA